MIMPPGIGGLETYEQDPDDTAGPEGYPGERFSASDEMQQAIKQGASSFLRKPYTVQELASMIKEALTPEERMTKVTWRQGRAF